MLHFLSPPVDNHLPRTLAYSFDKYWSMFLHTCITVIFSYSHPPNVSLSSVSAVPREHFSPGEPASGDVRSAGSCCGCWRGLQWQGHIRLHAQRLHCARIQYTPRYWYWSTHMLTFTCTNIHIEKSAHTLVWVWIPKQRELLWACLSCFYSATGHAECLQV